MLGSEDQVAVLLVVAAVYALFDVFNKRNIPDFVVYATIVIGIAVAVLYSYSLIWVDFGIAAIVGLIGFVIYRAGFLGGGDVLELVFISLVLPIQGAPHYSGVNQLGIPFVLSVIVGAGYTASLFIPIYYLLVKKILAGKPLTKPSKRALTLGGMMLLAYIAFGGVFLYISNLGWVAVALVLILAIASSASLMFEFDIYSEMTSMIYPSKLESGDMVALNLMKERDIEYFKKKYSGFGRLVTSNAISRLKGVKKRLPVYSDSVPFSLFILFGVIISLAVGNLILIIVGA